MTICDFTVKSQKGEDVSLDTYNGKVLLIVKSANVSKNIETQLIILITLIFFILSPFILLSLYKK